MKLFVILLGTICLVQGTPTETEEVEAASKTPLCPKGETFECSLSCHESCDKTTCHLIKMKCHERCFCENRNQTIRDADGKCVSVDQCPKKCSPNSAPGFDNVCSDLCGKETMRCVATPVNKCFCGEGYARLEPNSECIPIGKCPGKCPPHSTMKFGGACDDHCEKMPCTKNLVERCFCDEGFVRLHEKGECVPESECLSEKCKKNGTIFNECGSACPETCDSDENGRVCTLQCVPRCECPKGQVMLKDGKCGPKSECPPKNCCPPNMSMMYGNECTDSCGREQMDCKGLALRKDCFCNKGFYRVNGKCVPFEECLRCSGDAEFRACGNACDNLCPGSGVKCDCKCFPGCYCKKGLMYFNGQCVARNKVCPRMAVKEDQFAIVENE